MTGDRLLTGASGSNGGSKSVAAFLVVNFVALAMVFSNSGHTRRMGWRSIHAKQFYSPAPCAAGAAAGAVFFATAFFTAAFLTGTAFFAAFLEAAFLTGADFAASAAFCRAHRSLVASPMAFLAAALNLRLAFAGFGAGGADESDTPLIACHRLRWAIAILRLDAALNFLRLPGAASSEAAGST